MPWRARSPLEERLELIREYETGLLTMTRARRAVRGQPQDRV